MATSLKPSMQSVLEVGNGGSAEEAQKILPCLDANKSSDGIREEQTEPSVPDCQSMKSDKSMHLPPHFNGVCPTSERSLEPNSSVGSSDDGEMDSQGSGVTHQRRKCAICVGRIHKAVKFCKVCKAAYCEDHVRDHYKAPGLKKHTLVDDTDEHGHVEIERTLTQVGLRKKTLGLLWILIPSLLGLGGLWYHMSPTVEGKVRLDMRIVLLGKTGSGKSSTGNTILGREAFRAEASPMAVTTKCEKHNVVIGQNRITVIDTPGILGTLLQPKEVMVKTAECINTTPHAFLLVTRLGEFTDEDRKSVQWIQEHFGEEALKYTIVLFTGVDQLEGKPVEMFIKGSSHLLQVINSCGDRYHVFNNKDKNDNTQVSELLEKIEELLNEYRGYHHEADLLTQERVREEEMRKRERAQIIQEEGKKRDTAEREIREEEEKKRKELNDLALKDVEKSAEKISDSDIKFKLTIIVATIITLIIFCFCKSNVDINKEKYRISIQKEQKLEEEIRRNKEEYEKEIRLLKEELNRTEKKEEEERKRENVFKVI
ncbi:immune-associated nucleotide-binding protein 13-like isoform X1 [Salvelinus namaycush]|uniref:GTPase IMAP family member 8 n=2 Tax=Salvelinus namaycush TaxID=8040 RepID=A0A8U0P332_SALNM|nr:immune-associated nucleotide-binding protein 13-like isoform X1 [Salvelinus namaycush]